MEGEGEDGRGEGKGWEGEGGDMYVAQLINELAL